jgi:hypothetical protein
MTHKLRTGALVSAAVFVLAGLSMLAFRWAVNEVSLSTAYELDAGE